MVRLTSAPGLPVKVKLTETLYASVTVTAAGMATSERTRNMGERAYIRRSRLLARPRLWARPPSLSKGRDMPTGTLPPIGPWPGTPLRCWPSLLQPDHTSRLDPVLAPPFSSRPVVVSSQLPSRKSA